MARCDWYERQRLALYYRRMIAHVDSMIERVRSATRIDR